MTETPSVHTKSVCGVSFLVSRAPVKTRSIVSLWADNLGELKMIQILDGLFYTKDDEWIKIEDGIATIGITDYAQDSLSDIVFAELPDVDDTFSAGNSFGVVESVKASAELYTPISGTITASNESVLDKPELLNVAPFDNWLIKITVDDPSELEGLMDAAAYKTYCNER